MRQCIIVLSVFCLSLSACRRAEPSGEVTRAMVGKLRKGMSWYEVESVLGPSAPYHGPAYHVLLDPDGTPVGSIELDFGKSGAFGPLEQVTINMKLTHVLIDPNGEFTGVVDLPWDDNGELSVLEEYTIKRTGKAPTTN